ncbi:MAG: tetratricopeptide repeat protein [Elusimicrobia bacterium]|nr:tetratricopeptide repeat protein [Elusimicrobiota bacterium]
MPQISRNNPESATLKRWLEAAVLAAAVAAAFANSLPNAFVFDDRRVIVENKMVTRADFKGIWTRHSSWFPDKDDIVWRPLTSTSFALNWKLKGSNPADFRAFNLLIHTANCVLTVHLAEFLGLAGPVPMVAGLLFALHPIHTEVLNSIVGRADLLATFFVLLACLAYGRGWRFRAMVFFGLGLLSKESAVPFILLVPLIAWVKFPGRPDWRRIWRDCILLAAIAAGYIIYREMAIGAFVPRLSVPFCHGDAAVLAGKSALALDNPLAAMPFPERFSNALYILWRYLLLCLLPWTLSADYSPNAIPLLGVFAFRNIFAAAVLAAACGLIWKWSQKRREVLFSAGFFLLTFTLVSNIPFPIGTIMGERLVYLPSIGFCLLVAMALSKLGRRPLIALAALILCFYAGRSFVRNRDWKDDNTLFLRTAETSPDSIRAMVNASQALVERKKFQEARDLVLQALRLSPTTDKFPLPYNVLGLAYMGSGNLKSAEFAFQEAAKRDPGDLDALVNIGIIFAKERRYDGAISAFETALLQEPEAAKLHYNLALACKQKGEVVYVWGQKDEARELFRKARAHYDKALELKPDYMEARASSQALLPWLQK